MIFYLIIFFLSLGGVFVLYQRNRDAFVAFNFASFMESMINEAKTIWRGHLRDQLFNFLEKRLRGIRILFLRMERRLFKTIHHIRGIKAKNGNGSGNGNGNGQ